MKRLFQLGCLQQVDNSTIAIAIRREAQPCADVTDSHGPRAERPRGGPPSLSVLFYCRRFAMR